MSDEYPEVSREDLIQFFTGKIWNKAIKKELQSWLDDIRDKLDCEHEPVIIHRLQGNIEAVKRIMNIDTYMIEDEEKGN
ncbi:MAG: hypothetical protein WC233_07945 [Sphaerochaeta sp.]|jgi:hypothetical protein